jgi:peptidyl-prolyl cis-trans isomerase C
MNLKAIGKLAALPLLVICTACGPALATSAPTEEAVPSAPGAGTQGEPPAPLETAAAPVDSSPAPDAPASPASEGPLAALVNDEPIYLADYERELGQYEVDLPARGIDPNSPEGQTDLADARIWILEWMITEKLIVQAAAEAGVTVSDEEVDAAMQAMIDENGGEESFTAKLAERGEAYEDAWQKVRVGLIVAAMNQRIIDGVPAEAEHVHARHILVDTPEEAERLHAQLQAEADFAALAKAYSQDPNTRETGGDLGFFPRGILTAPEVEEAAFALQPGQFSEVVPSLLGYHIVQVVERDPNREVSPDNLHLLQERALQEWVDGLWAQAVVQRFVEATP